MVTKVRVLIVDDSAFVRSTVTRKLDAHPDIQVVGVAVDGVEALEQIKSLGPDVVTLDIEMPNMDGLTALERIMKECPVPVVMLSSRTGEGTKETLRALELGAVDFYCKPSKAAPVGDRESKDLSAKVLCAARIPRSQLGPSAYAGKTPKRVPRQGKVVATAATNVLVIASSTGGPKALLELIPRLPGNLPAAVIVVQHMPAGFTLSMAERLSGLSGLKVVQADDGDTLQHGKCLIAPGGYHLTINKSGEVELNTDPLVNGVRPAADITMKSVAQRYGNKALGVVLTGMGQDGAAGAGAMRATGGRIIAEHESTCVVYGMPRSVIEAGFADHVVPLHRMANSVIEMLTTRRRLGRERDVDGRLNVPAA
ncbi:MAG: chemotaxis response regulator protein-glutamate methylesterase [Chloroflexi bacterium]|nr:chemotaxis response regulator protein-glutamate methylesterase [Chloroflexota bacterium]